MFSGYPIARPSIPMTITRLKVLAKNSYEHCRATNLNFYRSPKSIFFCTWQITCWNLDQLLHSTQRGDEIIWPHVFTVCMKDQPWYIIPADVNHSMVSSEVTMCMETEELPAGTLLHGLPLWNSWGSSAVEELWERKLCHGRYYLYKCTPTKR